MSATLLAIHGTVTRPGRLYQAIQAALSGLDSPDSIGTDPFTSATTAFPSPTGDPYPATMTTRRPWWSV